MQKEYTQTKEQVLEGLRTDRQGLSAQEAEKRLQEHGENRLKEAEKLTLFQRFVQQRTSHLWRGATTEPMEEL